MLSIKRMFPALFTLLAAAALVLFAQYGRTTTDCGAEFPDSAQWEMEIPASLLDSDAILLQLKRAPHFFRLGTRRLKQGHLLYLQSGLPQQIRSVTFFQPASLRLQLARQSGKLQISALMPCGRCLLFSAEATGPYSMRFIHRDIAVYPRPRLAHCAERAAKCVPVLLYLAAALAAGAFFLPSGQEEGVSIPSFLLESLLIWGILVMFCAVILELPLPRMDLSLFLTGPGDFMLKHSERAWYLCALALAPAVFLLRLKHGTTCSGENGPAAAAAFLAIVPMVPLFHQGAVLTGLLLSAAFLFEPRCRKILFAGCGAAGIFWLIRYFSLLFLPLYDFFTVHHLCPLFNSIHMVCQGFLPGTDFPSQYGWYSLFLAPWFKLWSFTPEHICAMFAVLAIVSLAAMFFALKTATRHTATAVFALSAIGAIPLFSGYPELYLQYFPLRTVYIALFLLCYSCFCRTGSKSAYLLLPVLPVLGFFFNPDSGAVLLLLWLLLLLLEWTIRRPAWRILLKQMLYQFLFFGGTAAIFLLIVRFLSGRFPNPTALLIYPKIFTKAGFFNLPTPFPGGWLTLMVIYGGALAYSLRSILRKTGDDTRFLCCCALLGFGIFPHYLGRSVPGNLLQVSYPAWLIAAQVADRLLDAPPRLRLFALPFGTLLLAMILQPLFLRPPQDLQREKQHRKILWGVRQVAEILQTHPDATLLPLCQFGAFYAASIGARSPFPHASYEEMILKNDANAVLTKAAAQRQPPLLLLLDRRHFRTVPAIRFFPPLPGNHQNIQIYRLPLQEQEKSEAESGQKTEPAVY